jgi:hypothetical protein
MRFAAINPSQFPIDKCIGLVACQLRSILVDICFQSVVSISHFQCHLQTSTSCESSINDIFLGHEQGSAT